MIKKIIKYSYLTMMEYLYCTYGFFIWIFYMGIYDVEITYANKETLIKYPKL